MTGPDMERSENKEGVYEKESHRNACCCRNRDPAGRVRREQQLNNDRSSAG